MRTLDIIRPDHSTPAWERLEWLIVGGGLHGVHAALRLITEAGVAPNRLLIVDPAPSLFARWRERTGALAMTYLRSPAVHNLGRHPDSLHRFAGKRRNRPLDLFAQPYNRPSVRLFDEHCDTLVDDLNLSDRHLTAKVSRIVPHEDRVAIETAAGTTIESARLLLATGPGRPAEHPAWYGDVAKRVERILDPGYRWTEGTAGESVAVVGGGMTAAHTALRLASEGARVHVIARHAVRERQFDSSPGWLGPKYMAGFERCASWQARRSKIDAARYRGSITPDLQYALNPGLRNGKIQWHVDHVDAASPTSDGLELRLASAASLGVQRAILCTGFAPGPPSPGLIDSLAQEAGLPRSECGFPVIDRALRWHPRIHVSGALAELRLGPTARNIAGARRTGDLLVESLAEPPALELGKLRKMA